MAHDVISRIMGSDWTHGRNGHRASGVASPTKSRSRSPYGRLVTKDAPPPDSKSLVQLDFVASNNVGSVLRLGLGSGDAERVNLYTAYAAALYCYVAINWRARNVSEPPLAVIRETDDGDEIVDDHPLSRVLAEPSLDYDMGEVFELTQVYLDTGGAALWVKDETRGGDIGRLTPFSEREFTVDSTADRIYGSFELDARRQKRLDAEQVVFFRNVTPFERHQFQSPTSVALGWLNLGKRVQATVRNLLENAMFPSVVISPHQDWNPEPDEYKRFKDAIAQYHQGPANAGEPFVALGGSDVQAMSLTMRELLPEELFNRIEANVAAAYGVPPVVLSYLVGLQNSPWSQMEEARRRAYEDTIEPLWRKHAKVLTRQLLRPVDDDPALRIDFDTSDVRALQDDRSARIKDASAATFMTVNQRLALAGEEPLPDDDPRGSLIEAVDLIGRAAFGAPSIVGSSSSTASEKRVGSRDWHWARFDLMAKAQEEDWSRTVRAELDSDKAAVLERVRSEEFVRLWSDAEAREELRSAPGPDTKEFPFLGLDRKGPDPDPRELQALIAALAKALDAERWTESVSGRIESTAATALREVAADLGVSFDLLSRSLLDYTRREAGWLVTNIQSTTRDRLAAELKAGLAEGESIDELTARIEADPSGAFNRDRAELISRTETTRVTNGSQRENLSSYATDNVVTVEKQWLSARDGRVRPEHAQLDAAGLWIGVDETFANGLTEPSEPNCRCTLLFRMPEQ